ncbi:MAG: diadenylate cyclase CdaA [Prevotella sp.]|uniref:diadenylate cyclase CdaA n=1 Tax=Prevotella sp. TaxID=59823 RepID=UPI002A305013|nr:diadenylate cyclase CdaA [Prevotella sp.]MDD7317236.1 diadenylate cyclase CdaA [Prevotellaceae bacterium]MDY4019840.1 diadenylate cyclase CdaA [Prevotella sp.]
MFDFGIKDIIDILAVALGLYYIYRVMRASRSLNVFGGIIMFFIVWIFVSRVFEMRLLGAIMDNLMSVGVIALIILFQDEIRKFFYNVGAHQNISALKKLLHGSKKEKNVDMESVMAIVRACMNMGRGKVGALIIIERNIPLDDIVETGERIDSRLSQRLLENIFFKNSPLHDGAMVISKQRIKAAGCILPVSHDDSIPKELGLRHRAAMGISEESDAIAVVVSEETGRISVASHGKLQLRLSAEDLESLLTQEM